MRAIGAPVVAKFSQQRASRASEDGLIVFRQPPSPEWYFASAGGGDHARVFDHELHARISPTGSVQGVEFEQAERCAGAFDPQGDFIEKFAPRKQAAARWGGFRGEFQTIKCSRNNPIAPVADHRQQLGVRMSLEEFVGPEDCGAFQVLTFDRVIGDESSGIGPGVHDQDRSGGCEIRRCVSHLSGPWLRTRWGDEATDVGR